MRISLDRSRPPKRHLRIAGLPRPETRVLPFRRANKRVWKSNRFGPALLITLLVCFVVVAYVSRNLSAVSGSNTSSLHALTPLPNCATARALGLAPAYRGEPGYRAHLDRDNDGI